MTAASLVTLVGRALAGEASLPPRSTLLVAVSGGPDSMALLDVTARLASKLELTIVAHGVDHGLRAEAAQELDLAATHAKQLGVRFGRTRVDVEHGGNLQARAREARYRALARAASAVGARAIATAHHQDDRAETVLLRLLRGAGARGLAVLPPRAPSTSARTRNRRGMQRRSSSSDRS
ncbi:tRNA(Ile)-lysidine synthetase [Labilithrix luteola]|uniref:tRNA(Ile)-lysidine synthetase n=1 Tax=Labilithrix luteola TaxID=1391654 RepID=A0A0K1Q526_9BACT|nr:tRNA lysidine(34) synthetase TilS [Labilithrix luteola]AKV00833.1 tRNA(Ile)-lysidine synthetase [Labilithrix luteola]